MTNPSVSIIGARVTSGHGQGKKIGVPTLNIDTCLMPASVAEGIYAARVWCDGIAYNGALHYGARPVFNDPNVSCEVHLIDEVLHEAPETIDLDIVARIRDVRNFESVEAMTDEIARDIEKIRAILNAQ